MSVSVFIVYKCDLLSRSILIIMEDGAVWFATYSNFMSHVHIHPFSNSMNTLLHEGGRDNVVDHVIHLFPPCRPI